MDKKEMPDNAKTIKNFNAKATEKATNLLENKTDDKTLTNQEIIVEKAQDTKENRAKQKEEEDKEKKRQEIEDEKRATILDKTSKVLDGTQQAIADSTRPARTFVERLPSPGGLTAIITALIFFVFALVPVNTNGDTRLKLLYGTLKAGTHLKYQDSISPDNGGEVTTKDNRNTSDTSGNSITWLTSTPDNAPPPVINPPDNFNLLDFLSF